MNFRRLDKTVVASVALHLLVFGWGLISFQSKAFESRPEESLPVDVISADQLAKVMAGMKTGKKDNPKPLVEKVAEAKPPVEDTVGKITEKAPVVTETKPPPPPPEPPKVVEKKPDPKPEPPKPVAEAKPETPKPVEKKPEPPKVDPIAEALKKEEKKEPPKPKEAKAAPPPPQPKQPQIQERHFDQSKIAALLDKRDPSRQAVTGDTLNSNAALGLAKGKAADNSATWGALFKQQVERCWKKPYGGIETRNFVAIFTIKLKRDGTLETTPVAVAGNSSPAFRAYQESAQRGIIECQPYRLPEAFFEEWKFFEGAFDEKTT